MNSNVEALQGLYVKMGGNLEDVSDKTTISEMIDAITKIGIVDRVARSGNYITATTAAEMNDESAIYVYTGSESGYNQGHLYYWDGTEYVDGGEYNGAKAEIDPTLSHTGKAADAKETGDKIRELNGSLETKTADLRTAYGRNRFNQENISGTGIVYSNGEFVGTALAFKALTNASNLLPLLNIGDNKRYTLSFKAYTDGNAGSSNNNGLQFGFKYDDNTSNLANCKNNASEYTTYSVTSTSDYTKHISGLSFTYGNVSNNVWHIKDIMVVLGTEAVEYVPYYTACDNTARNMFDRYIKNEFYNKAFMANGREKLAIHRGLCSNDIPWENSLPAFINAGENHAFGCETDIRTTSDGVFVCMHDANVGRTTDGTGYIVQKTLDEVQALHLINPSTGDVSAHTVPTFVQFLRICKMYAMTPIIEIKSVPNDYLDDFLSVIASEGMTDRCVVIIGDFQIGYFRKLNKTIPLMVNCDSTQTDYTTIIDTFVTSGWTNVGVSYERGAKLTEQIIATCRSNGYFVAAWCVDNISEAKNYMMRGVDIIVTNTLTTLES